MVQNLADYSITFMSKEGLDELGVRLIDLQKEETYEGKFFRTYKPEELQKEMNKLITKNDSAGTFTFFQEVKSSKQGDWRWHIGSARIFHWNKKGKPSHILKLIFPVERMKHVPQKAKRLVEETAFYSENMKKFENLGGRAKEVLRLVALGKTSAEISKELSIEVETVNTHRRNIKRKLGIRNIYDFTEYARAYDLI